MLEASRGPRRAIEAAPHRTGAAAGCAAAMDDLSAVQAVRCVDHQCVALRGGLVEQRQRAGRGSRLGRRFVVAAEPPSNHMIGWPKGRFPEDGIRIWACSACDLAPVLAVWQAVSASTTASWWRAWRPAAQPGHRRCRQSGGAVPERPEGGCPAPLPKACMLRAGRTTCMYGSVSAVGCSLSVYAVVMWGVRTALFSVSPARKCGFLRRSVITPYAVVLDLCATGTLPAAMCSHTRRVFGAKAQGNDSVV